MRRQGSVQVVDSFCRQPVGHFIQVVGINTLQSLTVAHLPLDAILPGRWTLLASCRPWPFWVGAADDARSAADRNDPVSTNLAVILTDLAASHLSRATAFPFSDGLLAATYGSRLSMLLSVNGIFELPRCHFGAIGDWQSEKNPANSRLSHDH